MAEVTVAIIGLGRIGASFGLALHRYMQGDRPAHRFSINGFDERGYNAKKAKELGAVDVLARTPFAAVEGAHIVLLTAPYAEIKDLYEALGPDLAPGTVVLDASPLKVPSLEWAAKYLPQQSDVAAYLVGITPVINPVVLFDCALDINDPDYARADLFDNSNIILAPSASCPSEAVDLAAEFSRIVGAESHFMDPAEHDGLIAAMEGLPALLSATLFDLLTGLGAWDDLRRLSNPAFALAVRHVVHQSPDSLWGLLHRNRENTARYLGTLIERLEAVRQSLESDADGAPLEALLAGSAQRYEQFERARFSNKWEKSETPPMSSATNFLGGIGTTLLGGRFGRRNGEADED